MIKSILLVLFASSVLAGKLVAGVDTKVVRVRSFPCHEKSNQRLGSGTLIAKDEAVYVLTSAHVVYHANKFKDETICHQVENEAGLLESGELIRVDSLNGLALIKLAKSKSEIDEIDPVLIEEIDETYNKILKTRFAGKGLPEYETIFGRVGLAIVGYRFNSNVLRSDFFSRIHTTRSDMPILPKLTRAMEVIGHSEYGMSGGAVFSPTERFIGTVSHHYIEIRQGRVFRVGRHDQPAEENHVEETVVDASVTVTLAITLDVVRPWVRTAIANAETPQEPGKARVVAGITEDYLSQLNNVVAINFEGIRFVEENCQGGSIGGGEGSGIGGGQGSGIGGGQGSGIGGRQSAEAIAKIRSGCRIKVAAVEGPGAQAWPFKSSRSEFLRLSEALEDGSVKFIPSLTLNGVERPFYSLHMALTLMEQKSYRAVDMHRSELPTTIESVTEKEIEIPQGTPCFCQLDEILGDYELFYRDSEGIRRHIAGSMTYRKCLAALARTRICHRKKKQVNMCHCIYDPRSKKVNLWKNDQGHAVALDAYDDSVACEKVKKNRDECFVDKFVIGN